MAQNLEGLRVIERDAGLGITTVMHNLFFYKRVTRDLPG